MGKVIYKSNLDTLMELKGQSLTQEQLAEIAKCDRTTISKYWKGRNVQPILSLTMETVEAFAAYFEVPWHYVVKRINTNGSHN